MRPERVSEDIFVRLASHQGADLISIFLPTATSGREVGQGAIRLKNALSAMDDRFESLGWAPERRSAHLMAADRLIDDREFWEHQGIGLAVYIDEGAAVTALSLSGEVDEKSFVLPVFQVRPLLPELDREAAAVLVLTRGRVDLFAADESSIAPISGDLPGSMADVNWFVDRERQGQQRPDARGSKRIHHGHEDDQRADEDVNRFLRAVSDSVSEVHGGRLVVVGDDDLISRFARVHPTDVLTRESSGLPGKGTSSEILDMVSGLLKDERERSSKGWIDEALADLGTGRATTDIHEAMPAAASGRVHTLLLWHDAEPVWGRFRADTLEVIDQDNRSPADVDLLDRLAVTAIENGASVRAIGQPIDGHSLVARFRY